MTSRWLFGKRPDGTYGVRISKPGYAVLSNPVDPEQLIFDSDWASLVPFYVSGTTTVANGVTANIPITPPASGSPMCIVAADIGSGLYEFYRGNMWSYAFNDSTLYIANFSGGTLTYKYWLLRILF